MSETETKVEESWWTPAILFVMFIGVYVGCWFFYWA